MAVIYEQSDIDKTFTAHTGMAKIEKNYLEMVGYACVYDLAKKKELILCLKDITKTRPVTKDQDAFITQCRFILDRLNKRKREIVL